MSHKKWLIRLFVLVLIGGLLLAACGGGSAEDAAAPADDAAPAESAGPVINSAGVELPDDAAPLERQVVRQPSRESPWMTWDGSVYDVNLGDQFAWSDSCVRPDKQYEPQPNLCTEWEVSEDGLTWTFKMDPDRVWSDGTPITAKDLVFTLQRYSRPDYDFEWFYSMMGVENWGAVVSGELPYEELGAEVVDDYTFTITTERPVPFLIKIMADVWVVPEHVVQDRDNDGTWALDEENYVFAGPYKLVEYNKGENMVFQANEMYTGPFPPLLEEIEVIFMEPETRFNAYKSDELDYIGGGYEQDLPPSAMAEISANPELQEQLISWPNFITYYLFFDTFNEPFDNLKVRQAISHAVDRDLIVNGPLKDQSVAAYSMNPPGFPGESVAELKDIQTYDPELAAQLMEEAGYPGGEGFPTVTIHTRNAFPALTNAAEAIAAMLTENLGMEVEIQDMDYGVFSESMYGQKSNMGGDFKMALVPYEFDFVDGSNLLGVWGGCEPEGADIPDMPGRHTWYSQEYNDLLCEAGSIFGDEEARNELYRQAERILIEDVALVPIYHGTYVAMVKPDIGGPMFEPNADGMITFNRYRFASREAQIYRTNE